MISTERTAWWKRHSSIESVPAFVVIDPAGRLGYRAAGWWNSANEGMAALAFEIQKALRGA